MPRPIHFEIQAEDTRACDQVLHGALRLAVLAVGQGEVLADHDGRALRAGIDGGLLPRPAPAPDDMAAVNAFVCTIDVADLDAMLGKIDGVGGKIVVPRMPIPTVGWLAYGKDTEGNIFGMMQMDARQIARHRERGVAVPRPSDRRVVAGMPRLRGRARDVAFRTIVAGLRERALALDRAQAR